MTRLGLLTYLETMFSRCRVGLKLSLFLALFLLFSQAKTQAREGSAESSPKISVMAPLKIPEDWGAFAAQLATLKGNGVQALTTDLWWGHFERAGDNVFDWSAYLRYAQVVRDSGLEWIPILSFHQCGDNVDDECDIPLPTWVWELGPDMKFRDEAGFINGEYVSFWFEGVYTQYAEAMASFAEAFADYAPLMSKVYLSLGPAGELRYPSYQAKAGWTYPQRGRLQAYSAPALRDFRAHVAALYPRLDLLNAAWGSSLQNWDQVSPPTDGDHFFEGGFRSSYGHDFLTWYQGVLSTHMQRMMALGREHLAPLQVSLGAKMSGVHWLYSSPRMPHAAEFSAGYYDYASLLGALHAEQVNLTFTCLEMQDEDRFPVYSAPRSLVRRVALIAAQLGLPLYGENALAIRDNPQAYRNVREVLDAHPFAGFTLLRMSHLVDEQGHESAEMKPFRETLIERP